MACSHELRIDSGADAVNLEVFDRGVFAADRPAASKSIIGDGWVGDETERFFRGRALREVTYESLSQDYRSVWWAAHNFLNDEAYLFFLPAFLKVALYDFDKDGAAQLADALANGFLRMAQGEHDDRLMPILQNYAKPQLASIAQFLVELSRDRYKPAGDMDDAEPALKLFWDQYLEG
jgi:hypothetical protein